MHEHFEVSFSDYPDPSNVHHSKREGSPAAEVSVT
jgi:hypothetical protein